MNKIIHTPFGVYEVKHPAVAIMAGVVGLTSFFVFCQAAGQLLYRWLAG